MELIHGETVQMVCLARAKWSKWLVERGHSYPRQDNSPGQIDLNVTLFGRSRETRNVSLNDVRKETTGGRIERILELANERGAKNQLKLFGKSRKLIGKTRWMIDDIARAFVIRRTALFDEI